MKKKILAIIVAVMMLSASLCIMTSAAAPLRIGDLNLDGELSIVDLVRLKKAEVGVLELDGLETLQADMDENGAVEATDIVALRVALLTVVEYGDNEIALSTLNETN